MIAALWGSFWVKVTGVIFLGLLVWGYGNGVVQGWKGEARGAAKVTAAVTKKADANAVTAERVGAAAEAGKGRSRNPYRRDDP